MKFQSVVKLHIDGVSNLGEVTLKWSISLQKGTSGVKSVIEVPDQIIELPILRNEDDSFSEFDTAPVQLSKLTPQIFSTRELEGESSIPLIPTDLFVDWNKKTGSVSFSAAGTRNKW